MRAVHQFHCYFGSTVLVCIHKADHHLMLAGCSVALSLSPLSLRVRI